MDAYLLRIGFEAGLYTRADVREWVERELGDRNPLPSALLELATIAGAHNVEVARQLRELEQPPDERTQLECELAVLAELYRRGQFTLRATVQELVFLHGRAELRDDEANVIGNLDAGYVLAAEGTWGTLDQVQDELTEFLARYPLP